MDRKSDDDDVLAVAKALRSFPYSFVLVGGAAVPFLLTDPIVSARSTLDFDIVVRIATRGEYYEVEEWLRDHEFTETKDGPICRWRLDEHLIDVMPTSEDVLGFSNQWYEAALQSATRHELEEDISIPVVAAPPFVGAKIEAFRSRGEDDYYASSDLEDIITVLNGRPEIVDEFGKTTAPLHVYVASVFKRWIESTEFNNALPGHLQHAETSPERTRVVENHMQAIIQQSESRNS